MENNNIEKYATSPVIVESRVRDVVSTAYMLMAAALLVTGITAYFVATNYEIQKIIFSSKYVFYGILIAQVLMVISIGSLIKRASATTLTVLFFVYSVLIGLTMSVVLLVYTRESVYSAFFITSGMFGALSVFGMATKRDLGPMGNFMFVGLIGIILATIANMFFIKSGNLTAVINYLGVVIFAGLTAYDTQKLKKIGESVPAGQPYYNLAVYGALTLYLDFINLFMFLLRIMGKRR